MKPTWSRFQEHYCFVPALELSLDISRMNFGDDFLSTQEPAIQAALSSMSDLERGTLANPDEGRMVGHYWLRAPELAPTPELGAAIRDGVVQVRTFAARVHSGVAKPPTAARFRRFLAIGIGGSALGPMLLADSLGHPRTDKLTPLFLDNTDPEGIARQLAPIQDELCETLVIVTSKSGGTPETRNGARVVAEAYRSAGLDFPGHAVAITMPGSKLDQQAEREGWLERFPMFDWVGGRTSMMSSVGLLPAALQGLDVDGLLEGAAACDQATRERKTQDNPAALLALMWLHATRGRGERDMVVLPYKDRLLLLSRYLQQLIMESLGKRLDLRGRQVDQGLTVYGNKGSTDQHAFVQQLRDGVNNFFVTFIRVLEAGAQELEVEPGVTCADYLHGFLLGTREALHANERESITLTIPRVDARSMGVLVALFERSVGLYASLVGINAYHQPGVEAGKKAAASILELQRRLLHGLGTVPRTAEELASDLGIVDPTEHVFLVLEHLAANGRVRMSSGSGPGARFSRAA